MPLDQNIILSGRMPQLDNPLDVANKALTMKQLSQSAAIRDRDMADEQSLRSAMKDNLTVDANGKPILNRPGFMSALAAGNNPYAVMDQHGKLAAMDAAEKHRQITELSEQTSLKRELIGQVYDQASYDQMIQKAHQIGLPGTDKMPPVYDKGLMDRMNVSLQTADQKFQNYMKQQAFGMEREKMGHQTDMELAKAGVSFEKQDRQFAHARSMQDAKLKALAEAKSGGKAGLTEGEKKVDQDYAKDYNDFTGGGYSKATDSIKKLKDFKTKMENDNGWFQAGGGPISGSMPDAVRTQSSISQRDNIVSVANSALKATFGGQLSDGERKALANEFYNDKLSNKSNLEIITRKITELENGLASQTAKAQHYERNRSLKGFKFDDVQLKQAGGDKQTYKTSDIEWAD